MLSPDTKFSHYSVVRPLGSGGMADVYEAVDDRLGRHVAIKVLPSEFGRNPSLVARFETEVRAAASLNHHGIVSVFEVGQDQGLHFFAMRLLTGGDLRQRIDKGLTQTETLAILREVADAFGHAHTRGFVHRDIKPENIMFDEQGYPVITDFGIAKAMEGGSRVTATGFSVGTPSYTSPEQARGQAVDARTDLYSLGVVLYEMLTGQPPYDGDESLAIIFKHVTEPIPQLPEAHAKLQPLLDRLMAKEPSQRPASARELIKLIDGYIVGQRGVDQRGGRAGTPAGGALPAADQIVDPSQLQQPKSVPPMIADDAHAFAEEMAAQVRRQEKESAAAPIHAAQQKNEPEVAGKAVARGEVTEKIRGPAETQARQDELDQIKVELQALRKLDAERVQGEGMQRRGEQSAIALKLQAEAEARRKAQVEQSVKEAARKKALDEERRQQAERLKQEKVASRKTEAERRVQLGIERLAEIKRQQDEAPTVLLKPGAAVGEAPAKPRPAGLDARTVDTAQATARASAPISAEPMNGKPAAALPANKIVQPAIPTAAPAAKPGLAPASVQPVAPVTAPRPPKVEPAARATEALQSGSAAASKPARKPLLAAALVLAVLLMLGGTLWWLLGRSSPPPAVQVANTTSPAPVAAPVAESMPAEQSVVSDPAATPVQTRIQGEAEVGGTAVAPQAAAPESTVQVIGAQEAGATPAVVSASPAPVTSAEPVETPPAGTTAPVAEAAAPVQAVAQPAAAAANEPGNKPEKTVSKPKPKPKPKRQATASAGKPGRNAQCEEILSKFAQEGDLTPAQRVFLKKNC